MLKASASGRPDLSRTHSPPFLAMRSIFEAMNRDFAPECSGTMRDPADWRKQQVSVSLQDRFCAPVVSPVRLPSDPYRRQNETQTRAYIDFDENRSQPSLSSPSHKLDFAVEWMAEMSVNAKPVASFLGTVDFVGERNARVHLISEATGERLESHCDLEILSENGIGRGDEFRCDIVRIGGMTATRLRRLAPRPVSKERVQEVRAQFTNRWNF
jgi:hypothetical protein